MHGQKESFRYAYRAYQLKPHEKELAATILAAFMTGEARPWNPSFNWIEILDHIHCGDIVEVDEETLEYWLEVLPPKAMRGNWFVFAERQKPLTLYWQRDGRYFVHHLSWRETFRFCAAIGLPLDYGC